MLEEQKHRIRTDIDEFCENQITILTYTVKVIGNYAQIERRIFETEEFYVELKAVYDKSIKMESYIGRRFQCKSGYRPIYKCTVSEEEQTINNNGRYLRDFGLFNALKITNTFADIRINTGSRGKQVAPNLQMITSSLMKK
jgi:hypothetical protein